MKSGQRQRKFGVMVHFRAVFLPDIRKFKVEFIASDRRWVELKTIANFLRWASDIQNPDNPLAIGGMTVSFNDDLDGSEMGKIRAYFKEVAESYKDAKYRK